MKKKIIILIAVVVLLMSWISIAYSDYADVAISFDKPQFCISTMTADDGGLGKYIGLGYSFEIDGHLDVDSGFEVDSYTYKIFGITIKQDEANPQKTANTHTLEVTENSVGEIGRETYNFPVEISEDDANALSQIINGGTWKEEITDCESDCVINLKGHCRQYDSERGILNQYDLKDMSVYSSKEQEVNGKSLVLSEEDRATVNTILEKYITLGIESN